ncbi:DSD1 family PLP-dependent enzyme [Ramlibacter sp. H39-3-26]|uniref:DSD1 family PLP-dependent enzyme n=1 Tax=Curvibacter soli TaxID=3031331 RepID=UPI0023DCD583|nr:DSD1 family PLP-dependent enzyme [Ramlibacter sp. H39-3-26]MDF1484526.1 DSD1 family PLP-dependent enzyme [Ramlibacter sp. H39-3-26]
MKPPPDTYNPATTGQRVDQIDTPALVVDLDAMERNIQRMAEFARKHQVRWRPHAKMHKSAELALQMQAAGATGACVQKTAEAEALAAGGVNDIFISNEVVAPHKLLRVARLAALLAARGGRLAIAVDSPEGIQRLGEALAAARAAADVLIEIDVGQGRCGAAPGPETLALAQAVHGQPQMRFAGLHAYHGGAQHLRSARARREAIAGAVEAARRTRDLIAAAGIDVPLVTGAGTGTLVHEAASGVYGELQAGSFLFMDADYAANEREPAQPNFEHALFVKTQVISARATHAVCDAGHKSHAIDSGLPRVLAQDDRHALDYASGGDEHGILRARRPGGHLPALGQMLWLIPGHCDPSVNLHDVMVGVRGGLEGGAVERLLRVDARGALS